MRQKEFTRKELSALGNRIEEAASEEMNPLWKMAYTNLAFALSALDAFMARSESECPSPRISLRVITPSTARKAKGN